MRNSEGEKALSTKFFFFLLTIYYRDEAMLIEEIAKSVSNKLSTVYQNDFPDLVGIDERIEELESLMG